MKPYDRLTIIRNRHRARDLRIFRVRVRAYFEHFEYDAEDLPVDWEGARAVEILHDIFSDRYASGEYQEVLDVIDMAVGVYDAHQYGALMRTFNPFHYVMTALGFLAGLPRRSLIAIGLLRPRSERALPGNVAGMEAALSRLAGAEGLIETRFAEMREWQSRLFAEQAEHLTDIAERMDFVERVLAQPGPVRRLKAGEKKASTPV